MTSLLKSVTAFLRDEYGVRDATQEPGGNHPRLAFIYADRPHTITLHNPSGDLGRSTIEMKFRDIRRLLGDPPPRPPEQPRRSLAEMTHTLEARAPLSDALGPITPPMSIQPTKTYTGAVSLTMSLSLQDKTRRGSNNGRA
jgi:hypothetical protein